MTPTTTELVRPAGVSEHARRAARAWQRMLPAFVALACAAPPASAQTYSVDVQSELGGLPVEIDTVPMEGMLIVKVTNGADVKVRCDLRYDASPQPIGRSYLFIEPGKTEQDAFRAKRNWYQVAVEVKCTTDAKR
jgi:hypothetical protein